MGLPGGLCRHPSSSPQKPLAQTPGGTLGAAGPQATGVTRNHLGWGTRASVPTYIRSPTGTSVMPAHSLLPSETRLRPGHPQLPRLIGLAPPKARPSTHRDEAGDKVCEDAVRQVPGAKDQLLGLIVAGQLQGWSGERGLWHGSQLQGEQTGAHRDVTGTDQAPAPQLVSTVTVTRQTGEAEPGGAYPPPQPLCVVQAHGLLHHLSRG